MKKALYTFGISIALISCGSSKKGTQSTPQNSSKTDIVTTYAETITADELKNSLFTYASDDFAGRETGEEGQKKAVEFLREHYIKYGVPAAKKDGNYFQEVPLQISENPEVNLLLNGTTYTYLKDLISFLPSASGTLTSDQIIYAGFGIEDEKFSSYTNLDVKGKIVLIKAGEPQNEDGTFTISGSSTPSKWGQPRQQFAAKIEAAKAKGAKVILFYFPGAYQMVAMQFGGANGRMSLASSKEETYFFMVNDNLAKAMVADIDSNNNSKVIPASIEMKYTNKSKPITSENVAAFIKGSEKPDEIIVISAHLDHEGVKDGKVYNGADDDGSGTVAILEIAEAFSKAVKDGKGPKRSILFLNVTAEEKGLLGSMHYTDVDPIFPLENTVANLNIDMIGRVDPKRKSENRNYVYLIGSDKLSTELHNVSEEINAKYTNIELDYTFNDDNDPNRFYYRSDHYNFAKHNVPIIFYFNGTHDDYHQPTDTPDKIEYDLLENRTRLVFYTAWEIANREQRIIVDKAITKE